MRRLILRKFGELIVVLLVVSIVSFMLLSLVPGGSPAVRILGDQATPESVAELNEELGLNDPVPVHDTALLAGPGRDPFPRSDDFGR